MINQVSVIGAGIMGNGIAQVIATAGVRVSIYDIDENNLSKAFLTIEQNLNKMVEKSILNDDDIPFILENIQGTSNLEECLSDTNMVIEVVPENLTLKQSLYEKIESMITNDVIIASNTSAIPLSELTEFVKYPERFIITHFINPAPFIPLVEIIAIEETSKEVIVQTMDFIKKLGKSPVQLKKEIPGAVVNRLQAALLREAFHIVEEGVVTLQDIDEIMKEGPGFRWGIIGPMQMVDLGGLDTWGRILDHLGPELASSKKSPMLIKRLVEQGNLGGKVGKGIYEYDGNSLEEIIKDRDNKFIELLKLKSAGNKQSLS